MEYLIEGKVVAAGTHPRSGTAMVTARARMDYVLAEVRTTPDAVTPAAVVFYGQGRYRCGQIHSSGDGRH